MMIMVVIGKKNLSPGRSTMMSPGSLPSGNLESHGQRRPIAAMINPRTMRARCISRVCARLSRTARSADTCGQACVPTLTPMVCNSLQWTPQRGHFPLRTVETRHSDSSHFTLALNSNVNEQRPSDRLRQCGMMRAWLLRHMRPIVVSATTRRNHVDCEVMLRTRHVVTVGTPLRAEVFHS